MGSAHLIINPNSGSAEHGDVVREWARRAGARICPTHREGDARRLAREAVRDGAELVIAAGGDGTAADVADGIADAFERVTLAIVPLGTGNDLARSLNLEPEAGPAAAMHAISQGCTRRIDALRTTTAAGTRHLVNAASGGFATHMRGYLDGELKRWLGAAAYPLAAIRAIADIPWHTARIEADGATIEAATPCVIIANGRFVAGGREIAPAAAMDDGLADLIIVTAETLAEQTDVLLRYLARMHTDSPGVIHRRVRAVAIACDPPMGFNGDGEAIGDSPLRCDVLPGALRVIVPPAKPAG